MPFARCYFHVVWATKHRAPIITPPISSLILESIQRKSHELDSPILAIYVMPDHVHVAVSLNTRLAVSEWVRQVKGLSSHEVRTRFTQLEATFSWQKSYGALTFGTNEQDKVCAYINRQREHHANNSIYTWLERTMETNQDE